MSQKIFIKECGKSKAGVCVMLILALFTVYVQPGFAITPAAPQNSVQSVVLPNAQLLSSLLAPSRVVVRDSDGLLGINLTCALLGCTVLGGLGDPQAQLFVVTTPSLLSPATFIALLLQQGGVVDAEIDQTVKTLQSTVGTAPSYLSDQKPVSYYGATVWEGYVTQTPNQLIRTAATHSTFNVAGRGVIVAVIDTGVDPNNPVLQSQLVYGYDFTRNKSGGSEMADLNQSTAAVLDGAQPVVVNQSTAAVLDQSTAAVLDSSQYAAFGHGTMTAGIVHLVAPQAKIMPLKAFNSNGTAYSSDILRAIYYAANHGAKVINMSFSYTAPSPELANAVNYAADRGLISVASAGNSDQKVVVYPGGLKNVIDVASTNNSDVPSNFSNYGAPPVWMTAPGEAVMTTYPWGSWAAGWGTSFSAPFVSGTAVLLINVNSSCNQSCAATALSHADYIPDPQYGYGRLDTYLAVQAAEN